MPKANYTEIAYRFNQCFIDPSSGEVIVGALNHQPDSDVIDTIVFLIENRHRWLSLEDFKKDLWRDSEATEFEIALCILKARKLLGDHTDHKIIGSNKDGKGYRFLAPVTSVPIEHFSDTTYQEN